MTKIGPQGRIKSSWLTKIKVKKHQKHQFLSFRTCFKACKLINFNLQIIIKTYRNFYSKNFIRLTNRFFKKKKSKCQFLSSQIVSNLVKYLCQNCPTKRKEETRNIFYEIYLLFYSIFYSSDQLRHRGGQQANRTTGTDLS